MENFKHLHDQWATAIHFYANKINFIEDYETTRLSRILNFKHLTPFRMNVTVNVNNCRSINIKAAIKFPGSKMMVHNFEPSR
jgi:hypothetical protein